MGLPYSLVVKQLTSTSVLLYADGTSIGSATLKQYDPDVQSFVNIDIIEDLTDINGITVSSLTINTEYTWILVDEDTGLLSNVVKAFMHEVPAQATLDAVYVKSEDLTIPEYRVDIEISNAVNITDKVLVIRRLPDGTDAFYTVAHPVQIDEFPEDAPNATSPFFRVNKFRLTSKNLTEARSIVTRLKIALDQTVRNWNYLKDFNYESELVNHPRPV